MHEPAGPGFSLTWSMVDPSGCWCAYTVLINMQGVDLLVLGIVAYSAIGALNPKSPTFSEANQRDVRKRPAGARTAFNVICYTSHSGWR